MMLTFFFTCLPRFMHMSNSCLMAHLICWMNSSNSCLTSLASLPACCSTPSHHRTTAVPSAVLSIMLPTTACCHLERRSEPTIHNPKRTSSIRRMATPCQTTCAILTAIPILPLIPFGLLCRLKKLNCLIVFASILETNHPMKSFSRRWICTLSKSWIWTPWWNKWASLSATTRSYLIGSKVSLATNPRITPLTSLPILYLSLIWLIARPLLTVQVIAVSQRM